MHLLLDTCTFLWIVSDDTALSEKARELFVDPANNAYLSPVSAWEIAVKYKLGKLELPDFPARYVPQARERHMIECLPLVEEAALAIDRLPDVHRDPFDRMLVCQALHHAATILTPDPLIAAYPVATSW